MNRFADVVGVELAVKFDVISASACFPIEGFDLERIHENLRNSCRNQIQQLKSRLDGYDGIILAGKWSFHAKSDLFMSALQSFIEALQENGTPVLILAQVPKLEGDIQRMLRYRALGAARDMTRASGWEQSNARIRDLADRHANTSYLDLAGSELFSSAPFYNETLIYFDSHHLNEVGSMRYGLVAASEIEWWIRSIE